MTAAPRESLGGVSTEPQTNIGVVREGYERFNSGELGWVVDHLAPQIVWHDAEEVPDARTYHGVEEVRNFLESFARHWEELRFEPHELLEGRGVVLARCRLIGRGRASGAEVNAEVIHVWRMRRLKVVAVRTFFDREAAAAEAGIELDAG
jgi:ketosteroid isomerase-like protein